MTSSMTSEDPAAQIVALREELSEFRRAAVRADEVGGQLADYIEERLIALEETVARRWPARRFAAARLRRSIGASMKHVIDPGETWADRRAQAAHVEFHAGQDEQRAAG